MTDWSTQYDNRLEIVLKHTKLQNKVLRKIIKQYRIGTSNMGANPFRKPNCQKSNDLHKTKKEHNEKD